MEDKESRLKNMSISDEDM